MRRRPRRLSPAAEPGTRAGFVLAGALVAFAVLAGGLGLIVTGIAVALRADGRAASGRAALREAEARLARAGALEALAASDASGTDPGGARWRVTVIPVVPDPIPEQPRARGGPPSPSSSSVKAPAAFWVSVTVSMPDGAAAALAGLKLGPAA